ncbi:TetR/AcrR family transcriptional regulator [Streptomyces agglomeratus]|uniref:TetR/AcrR family transcriptional regulator n=1 Tax=Streptomyces agglomeratus TaxID=285458 RepID=UPI00210C5A99|nr:TetR family transcriptional regulator [Streptomyces agglomeratus]
MTGQALERRRAPSMSPELRRQMIVRSTLSLIAGNGLAVTTGRIARAAGISEATIFHVFTDKGELLDACIAEAARADDVVCALADIPLDASVAARLLASAEALEAYLTRMGTVVAYLETTGHARARGGSAASAEGMREVREAVDSIVASLSALLAPEEESLRLPAPQIARAFFDLLFARSRNPDHPLPAPCLPDLVQLLVHGALVAAAPPPR